ncbi:PRC-barrel domain containing protein [Halorarum salinum]|uniref:PRC-barrel domain containing protein n=1 Tax=Halorarum salinum TaxID=2743089 RepID=A0A7D5LB55_9EURY|nr:PRC-barrel domain containing protein [Halobaculum salinum]QLG62532.1 PRC-barrel domain containing protein [Halobaculum salinum]
MSQRSITEEDEGKRVVNENGDEIGMVSDVRGGTAYVDPDAGLGDTVLSKLGWSDADEDDYPLDRSKIESITDDEIRLKREL